MAKQDQSLVDHPLVAPKVKYPDKDFTFWKRRFEDKDYLTIVNGGDFPRGKILSSMNIDNSGLTGSFGICDEGEIKARLALMEFLHTNQEITKFLRTCCQSSSVPTDEDDFMMYFNPKKEHNPHWETIHQLLELIDKAESVPERIQTFVDTLKGSKPLEQSEKEMARVILNQIINIANLEGTFSGTIVFGATKVYMDPGWRIVKEDEVLKPGREIRMDLAAGVNTVKMTKKELEQRKPNRKSHHDEYDSPEEERENDRFVWLIQAENIEDADFPEFHGYSKYSYPLLNATHYDFPKWTRKGFNIGRVLGIGKLWQWLIKRKNAKAKLQAMQEMVISKPSGDITSDVKDGLLKKLNTVEWNKVLPKSVINDAIRSEQSYQAYLQRERSSKGRSSSSSEKEPSRYAHYRLSTTIYLHYSKDGLFLKIISILPLRVDSSFSFKFADFEGYTPKQKRIIKDARDTISAEVQKHQRALAEVRLSSKIDRQAPDFFNTFWKADSPETDKLYRWFMISNMLASSMMVSVSNASQKNRDFFNDYINEIRTVIGLLAKLQIKAKELKAPLCFAKILDGDQHIVSFDQILPMHLLLDLQTNGNKIVPINNMPSLNGQMVCLTGRNGGGKTVAKLSLGDIIFLVQSGLPVFGKGVQLNVKKMLGMVFIGARGEHGSTFQTLVTKTKNVLVEANKYNPNEVVMIIDELGTGTQQHYGQQLADRLLNTLNSRGISTIFSTQITEVAEGAKNRLNAQCVRLDKNHRIHEGIGDGEADQVMEELGLDKVLDN